MADNSDRSSEDLTEEASAHRLEEFRQKGQVAQSRELTSLVALLAAGATIYMVAPDMGAQISEFMRDVFRTDLSSRLDLGSTHVQNATFMKALKILAAIALPVCGVGFLLSALTSFSQIGSIFTFEPLTPDLSKIDPIKGLQRMFSFRHLIDGAKLIFKMIAVGIVAYGFVKTQVLQAPALVGSEPPTQFAIYGEAAKGVFVALLAVLFVFAIIDFGHQKWEYQKSLRMTKQEAKQEAKERDGDPQIKARIRAIQREMARKRMMQAVKKADVIITNPTHIAIALVYDKEKMAAPKVVAKGADFLAQKIKKLAAEAGVPLVENVPLARTLYKTVKVGQGVPRALYQAVAEVLAYVYRLKNRML